MDALIVETDRLFRCHFRGCCERYDHPWAHIVTAICFWCSKCFHIWKISPPFELWRSRNPCSEKFDYSFPWCYLYIITCQQRFLHNLQSDHVSDTLQLSTKIQRINYSKNMEKDMRISGFWQYGPKKSGSFLKFKAERNAFCNVATWCISTGCLMNVTF